MCSIELSDPKLLAEISKVENDEKFESDFEAMAAFILPHDPVTNNAA